MRRHKYGAKSTVMLGIRFASQAEAGRYLELVLLDRGGQITGLRLQPRYALTVAGQIIGHAVFDFEYHENGTKVVEDVKGMDLPLSRWKRKHFEAEYGVAVSVIGAPSHRRAKRLDGTGSGCL